MAAVIVVFLAGAILWSAVNLLKEEDKKPMYRVSVVVEDSGSETDQKIYVLKVNDEVDALVIMKIPPMRFLAAPRILALVLMSPLLMFYCCIVGTVGGAIVGHTQLRVDFGQFMSSALSIVAQRDLFVGLFKAGVFGLIIGTVSVAEGFGTKLGATGVGKSTQRAVIVSFLAILVVGYMITRFFYE